MTDTARPVILDGMTKDFYLQPGSQAALKEKHDSGLPWIRKQIHRLTCQVCGKTFYKPGSGVVLYCSETCEQDAARIRRKARASKPPVRACLVCGQSFTSNRKDKTYCSPACKQKAYRKTSMQPLKTAKR